MKAHEIRLMKSRMKKCTYNALFEPYKSEWYNHIDPIILANWFVHSSKHSHAELLQCAIEFEQESKMEALLEG